MDKSFRNEIFGRLLFMCDSGDRWVLCGHHSLIVSQHNKSLIEMGRTNIRHLAYFSSNRFGKSTKYLCMYCRVQSSVGRLPKY
jgi:hypothetical protein